MHFVLAKGTIDKPRKQKSYRKKKSTVQKSTSNKTSYFHIRYQYASDSNPWRQLPRNMFKHFGLFSLPKI